jgi:hypothetical protein
MELILPEESRINSTLGLTAAELALLGELK